ncbi:DUF349 domain-containing protein [Polaribacter sp. SA4-12]|uniref:DUF349 domain-containing protein n=1 Tax=Polaribacter sp. SA4-12 TaxID=1312072 RepID=UPI000B3C756C|nr:DUF349 domain-containing protein [Polaribacter sp. SA4-12]ARV13756.1 chromosome segregation protein [Polaribacter sp. SA4-12]
MLENNEENVDKTESKVEEVVNETSNVETEKVADTVEVVEEETTVKTDDTVDAVEEIEKSIAVDAEKEAHKEDESAVVDYSKLSLEDLVAELSRTISNNPIQKIKNQVESIKSAFNQQFGALLAEKKAAFLEAGGNSIDFQFSSPIKSEYNNLLSDYKKQRDAHYNDLDKQLSNNLEKKLSVIEQLKDLIENADTATMYKSFRALQDTWRAIGPVSKNHYNDTWKTFHHHVERFYDLLHLSNDFRDLDFKHNLEEKLKIIDKVNALVEEADINVAFKELQDLHKIWKEDIGPVSQEMREDVWQKFSAATKKIHDRRHDHFREMRSKYQEIIDKKLAIVDKLNAYDTSNNKSHNDWQKSIKEVEVLRQEYFNSGKLPYSKSEEVWQKFKGATKKFNSAKNVFYKHEKNDQQDNLKKKMELIELAESLKESDDWESSTNTLKKIQSDWKKIGHVPRKFSDDIWKRFKAACNHYFDRYHDQKNSLNKDQQVVVDAKKAFLETVKELKEPTKDEILEVINNWRDLGALPRNARHIDGKFNKLIDRALGGLDLGKNEVSMLKFTHVIDSLAADDDVRKLDSEQMFVRKKIDEVVKEIQQLENNLGFFSNAKDDNPLVLNVKNRVNEFKEDLALWKTKLTYIKKLDY